MRTRQLGSARTSFSSAGHYLACIPPREGPYRASRRPGWWGRATFLPAPFLTLRHRPQYPGGRLAQCRYPVSPASTSCLIKQRDQLPALALYHCPSVMLGCLQHESPAAAPPAAATSHARARARERGSCTLQYATTAHASHDPYICPGIAGCNAIRPPDAHCTSWRQAHRKRNKLESASEAWKLVNTSADDDAKPAATDFTWPLLSLLGVPTRPAACMSAYGVAAAAAPISFKNWLKRANDDDQATRLLPQSPPHPTPQTRFPASACVMCLNVAELIHLPLQNLPNALAERTPASPPKQAPRHPPPTTYSAAP